MYSGCALKRAAPISTPGGGAPAANSRTSLVGTQACRLPAAARGTAARSPVMWKRVPAGQK
jgi:hypothetical protein